MEKVFVNTVIKGRVPYPQVAKLAKISDSYYIVYHSHFASVSVLYTITDFTIMDGGSDAMVGK